MRKEQAQLKTKPPPPASLPPRGQVRLLAHLEQQARWVPAPVLPVLWSLWQCGLALAEGRLWKGWACSRGDLRAKLRVLPASQGLEAKAAVPHLGADLAGGPPAEGLPTATAWAFRLQSLSPQGRGPPLESLSCDLG